MTIHVACAVAAGCRFFVTTDDVIVRKMRGYADIAVVGPTEFLIEVD